MLYNFQPHGQWKWWLKSLILILIFLLALWGVINDSSHFSNSPLEVLLEDRSKINIKNSIVFLYNWNWKLKTQTHQNLLFKKMKDSSTDTANYVHIRQENLNSEERTQRWKKWKEGASYMCLEKCLWLRLHSMPEGICNSTSSCPESQELSFFCLTNKPTGSKVKWRHKGFRTSNRTLRKNQVELTRSIQDSPKPAVIKALHARKGTWSNSVGHNRRTRKMSLLACSLTLWGKGNWAWGKHSFQWTRNSH